MPSSEYRFYLDLVVVGLHDSRITSVVSGGMFGCLKDVLIL